MPRRITTSKHWPGQEGLIHQGNAAEWRAIHEGGDWDKAYLPYQDEPARCSAALPASSGELERRLRRWLAEGKRPPRGVAVASQQRSGPGRVLPR